MTVEVNLWLTQCWFTLIRLVSMVHFNCKATLTNDIDYSHHKKAAELVKLIIWGLYYVTIVITSFGGRHTDTHTHHRLD